jgi:hypothetical protein
MIHDVDPKPITGYGVGDTVVFIGTCKESVNWGSNDDPRDYLIEGNAYKVIGIEVHNWHTKVFVEGFEGKKFPSSAFRPKGVVNETN